MGISDLRVIHCYVWNMGGFISALTLKNFDTQFYKLYIFHQTYWQNTVLFLFLSVFVILLGYVTHFLTKCCEYQANVCYFLMYGVLPGGVFDGAPLTPPRGVVIICRFGVTINRMAWQWAETLVEIRGTLADIRGTTKLGCKWNFPKHEFNRPVCLEGHHYLLTHLSQ